MEPSKNNDKTFGTDCLDTLRPGDLCIRDLGYFSLKDLDQMDQQGEIIQLPDLFAQGVNFKEIINKEIQKHIKKNENSEFFTFTSISDTQGFLVKDGNLVIKFVQYEIGPRSPFVN